MNKHGMHFQRRQWLQGLSLGCGATLFSPFMRSVQALDEKQLPKRFVFIVKSSGIDPINLVPGGLPEYHSDRSKTVNVSLVDRQLPEIFEPFEKMKNRVTILQGLSGNNLKGNHTAGFGTLSCRNSELTPVGPSVDAILGMHHSTGPYPMFGFATNAVVRGQASVPDDAYVYPTMSAYKKGNSVAYQASPTKAFNELFGSAVLPANKLKNRSVIQNNLMDFLKEDAQRIHTRLGPKDREQFEGYIDTFETLKVREQRKAVLKNKIKTFKPAYEQDSYTKMQHMPRMEAQLDMGAAALIAGLTNVVSYRLDTLGTMYQGLGIGSMGLHAIGHGGTSNGFSSPEMRKMIDAYHLSLIHKMAAKFDAIKEGSGTMLDNTMIVYLSCAGGKHHGGNKDWPVILIGGMAGKIKMGRYVAYPSYTKAGHRPLSMVYQSLMAASGLEINDTFGDVDPALSNLNISGPLTEISV